MAATGESVTGPQIGDVKQTAAYRGLRAAVIILGVLIALALGTLVVGFVFKLGSRSVVKGETAVFEPPPGARIEAMAVSGDRLVLHLRTRQSEEVDIIDTESGHLISRLKFPPP